MNLRTRLIVLALACGASPALGQQVDYHWSWTEMEDSLNSSQGVFGDGILNPGEFARVSLDVGFSPAVGTPVTTSQGPGRVAGLHGVFFDVVATPSTLGTWTNLDILSGWGLGSAGSITPNSGILDIGPGQFVLPGNTANPANPVSSLWRGDWRPAAFGQSLSTINFSSVDAASTGGQPASFILAEFGPLGSLTYVSVPATSVHHFGPTGVNIPYMVPSPGAAAWMLGFGWAAAGRRSRTSGPGRERRRPGSAS